MLYIMIPIPIILIFKIYAYLYTMKSRLNITVDEEILNNVKRYAARKNISLSELIEQYFKTLTSTPRRKTIIQMVEELEKPKIESRAGLKEAYYEEQKKKYGF